MIHVCFALYDKTGTYSRFTGTAILSLFDNTNSKVTVHLLHDNTLTNDNREKFIQIADRYGQTLKFYNVEKLCADRLKQIEEHFPQAKESHFSIATFYRFFIPELLLPQGIDKAIYLDSDIIVNLDIAEFWQIKLGSHPLAVVPEIDNNVPVKEVALLVKEEVISEEIYFNAGILLMNLKILHEEEATIMVGMKFIGNYPRISCFDQDVLNYCFAASSLRLPIKFNFYVKFARLNGKLDAENKICHYADGRISLSMDLNDLYNCLFKDYFIKTPWFDSDIAVALSGTSLPPRKSYAVSVVIPMYNAEEYIGECLDSLLIQTFQDFEVIIVDDCSTDSSCEIVESYAPKFNGRLKLTKTEKNSGNGYLPRNIGIMLARGEYIQFLDADDMILSYALEALYTAALLYDAEVVYVSSYYMLNNPNNIYLYKDGTSRKIIDTQKEFILNNLNTNLSRLLLEHNEGDFRTCWTKFVQHDFLIKNKIFFPSVSLAGDFIWTINLYCHARRFLRIVTPLYFYRFYNNNSITRTIRTPQEQCWFWFSSFIAFARGLHELKKENEVLVENPLYSLMAFKGYLEYCFNQTDYARRELVNEEIYKVLNSEILKNSDFSAELIPFIFNYFDSEKKFYKYYAKPINKFRLYFTARIFVLMNKKMDKETISILSVSDEKAEFSKPEWWQRNGTCHMIDSYTGELDIVVKAVVEGNMQIRLGGPYVINPEDKSKRLPYWIDFTKLTINENTIFNTLQPAWNDKHYVYEMVGVKANEEIKIHIEWQPHRDNTTEIKEVTPPPPKAIALEQKVVTPALPKVNSLETRVATTLYKPESLMPRKFNPLITARIDAKFMGATGDFQILAISDKKASVSKPGWFQRTGIGYVIQSSNKNLTFIIRVTTDGQIIFNLRGMDVRISENWQKGIAKRIPYWIDYSKLIINEKTVLDKLTPTWCDEPYCYNLNVKADEEITVKVEWMPHINDH